MSNKEFFYKLLYEQIIQKYLFLQSLEKQFSDEYIKTMYRITPASIRSQYNSIPVERKEKIEQEVKLQIEQGNLDLSEKAKEWHRESLRENIKEQLALDSEKQIEGEDR